MKASQSKRFRGSIAARLTAAIALPIALLATVSGAATAPPVNPVQLSAPSGLPDTALPFTGVTAATFTATSSFSKLTTGPDAGVGTRGELREAGRGGERRGGDPGEGKRRIRQSARRAQLDRIDRRCGGGATHRCQQGNRQRDGRREPGGDRAAE